MVAACLPQWGQCLFTSHHPTLISRDFTVFFSLPLISRSFCPTLNSQSFGSFGMAMTSLVLCEENTYSSIPNTGTISYQHPLREVVNPDLSPKTNDVIKTDPRIPFDAGLGLLLLSCQKFNRFWQDYHEDIEQLMFEYDPTGKCTISDGRWTDIEMITFFAERFVTHPKDPSVTVVDLMEMVRSIFDLLFCFKFKYVCIQGITVSFTS